MANSTISITAGSGTLVDTYQSATGHRQRLKAEEPFEAVFRAISPVTPIVNTTVQRIGVLYNDHATRNIGVRAISFDIYDVSARVLGTPPSRFHIAKVAGVPPTNGNIATPVLEQGDSSFTAGILRWGSASDNTNPSLPTVTLPSQDNQGVASEWTSRMINTVSSGVGYEVSDRMHFTFFPFLELLPGELVGISSKTITSPNIGSASCVTSIRYGVYD